MIIVVFIIGLDIRNTFSQFFSELDHDSCFQRMYFNSSMNFFMIIASQTMLVELSHVLHQIHVI